MFCPKPLHEMALKRLSQHLKHKKDHGLVLNPKYNLCKLNDYHDAVFDGMFGHENHTDPACLNILTGSVINFAYYPVLWVSKLQTETALLTTESKIIVLDHCCRELFTINEITVSFSKSLSLTIIGTTMRVSIHE